MLTEKDNLQEFPYMPYLAKTDTEKSIRESYQDEIKTINELIKKAASECKTWVIIRETDVPLLKGLKGGALAWYYGRFGYMTKWFNETVEIHISWR